MGFIWPFVDMDHWLQNSLFFLLKDHPLSPKQDREELDILTSLQPMVSYMNATSLLSC